MSKKGVLLVSVLIFIMGLGILYYVNNDLYYFVKDWLDDFIRESYDIWFGLPTVCET